MVSFAPSYMGYSDLKYAVVSLIFIKISTTQIGLICTNGKLKVATTYLIEGILHVNIVSNFHS